MDKHIWQLQEAKNRLSQLIDQAVLHGPQTITRRGLPVVVVIPADDYHKSRIDPCSLVDFLMKSPLVGCDLVIERDNDTGRQTPL